MSGVEGDSAELLALQRVDETCTQLQQRGNYLEALECMERGLVLRQHFFGADSDEVWKACKTVGEMCNLLAMTYLQQEDFAMVREEDAAAAAAAAAATTSTPATLPLLLLLTLRSRSYYYSY